MFRSRQHLLELITNVILHFLQPQQVNADIATLTLAVNAAKISDLSGGSVRALASNSENGILRSIQLPLSTCLFILKVVWLDVVDLCHVDVFSVRTTASVLESYRVI